MRRRLKGKRLAVISARRRKIGAFIRRRRLELQLSQADLTRALGYESVMSISDVELGRVGVPFRRIYQFADVLRLPREEFLRFVMGETLTGSGKASARLGEKARRAPALTAVEREVVDGFRRLSSGYRRLVREQIRKYVPPKGRRASAARRGVAKRRY